MVVLSALTCMALNVYFESRGEPLKGQHAVALVTWNRAAHSKSNVCEVMAAKHQFSWSAGKVEKRDGQYVLLHPLPVGPAWGTALSTSRLTMEGLMADFTSGATHFHEVRLSPRWARTHKLVLSIGNHVFYKRS